MSNDTLFENVQNYISQNISQCGKDSCFQSNVLNPTDCIKDSSSNIYNKQADQINNEKSPFPNMISERVDKNFNQNAECSSSSSLLSLASFRFFDQHKKFNVNAKPQKGDDTCSNNLLQEAEEKCPLFFSNSYASKTLHHYSDIIYLNAKNIFTRKSNFKLNEILLHSQGGPQVFKKCDPRLIKNKNKLTNFKKIESPIEINCSTSEVFTKSFSSVLHQYTREFDKFISKSIDERRLLYFPISHNGAFTTQNLKSENEHEFTFKLMSKSECCELNKQNKIKEIEYVQVEIPTTFFHLAYICDLKIGENIVNNQKNPTTFFEKSEQMQQTLKTEEKVNLKPNKNQNLNDDRNIVRKLEWKNLLNDQILTLISLNNQNKKLTSIKVYYSIFKKLFYYNAILYLCNAVDKEGNNIFPAYSLNYVGVKLFFFARGPQISPSTFLHQLRVIKAYIFRHLSETSIERCLMDLWFEKESKIFETLENSKTKFGKSKKWSIYTPTIISTIKHLFRSIKYGLKLLIQRKKANVRIDHIEQSIKKACVNILYLFYGLVFFCRWSDLNSLTIKNALDLLLGLPLYIDSKQKSKNIKLNEKGEVGCGHLEQRFPHVLGLPSTILHLLGFDLVRYNQLSNHIKQFNRYNMGIKLLLPPCDEKVKNDVDVLNKIKEYNASLKIVMGLDFELPPRPASLLIRGMFEENLSRLINNYYDYDVISLLRKQILSLKHSSSKKEEQERQDKIILKTSRYIWLRDENFERKTENAGIFFKESPYYTKDENMGIDVSTPISDIESNFWLSSSFNNIFIVTNEKNLDSHDIYRFSNFGDVALYAIIVLLRFCQMNEEDFIFPKVGKSQYKLIKNMILCNFVNFGLPYGYPCEKKTSKAESRIQGLFVDDENTNNNNNNDNTDVISNEDFDRKIFFSKDLKKRIEIAKCHLWVNSHGLTHTMRVTSFSLLVSSLFDAIKEKKISDIAAKAIFFQYFKVLGKKHLNHKCLDSTFSYFNNLCHFQRNLYEKNNGKYEDNCFQSYNFQFKNRTKSNTKSLNEIAFDATQMNTNAYSNNTDIIRNSFWFVSNSFSIKDASNKNKQMHKEHNTNISKEFNTYSRIENGGFWEFAQNSLFFHCDDLTILLKIICVDKKDIENNQNQSQLLKKTLNQDEEDLQIKGTGEIVAKKAKLLLDNKAVVICDKNVIAKDKIKNLKVNKF